MPSSFEEIVLLLKSAVQRYGVKTPVEESPMHLFSKLDGEQVEQVRFVQYLLDSMGILIQQSELRKLFWWEKISHGQVIEAHFFEYNPIAWLLRKLDEAQNFEYGSVDTRYRDIATEIHRLLLVNCGKIIDLIIPPKVNHLTHEIHIYALFDLIDSVMEALNLDEEARITLYSNYGYVNSNHGLMRIINQFDTGRLTELALIQLLCSDSAMQQFALAAENANYFWQILEKNLKRERLSVQGFVQLRKQWLQIAGLSAEQINLLNNLSLSFLEEMNRQGMICLQQFYPTECFFYPHAVIRINDVCKSLPAIDLSASHHFYSQYLKFAANLLTYGDLIPESFFSEGFKVMLFNPHVAQTIQYLKLIKPFVPKRINPNELCDIIKQAYDHKDSQFEEIAAQLVLFIISTFNDSISDETIANFQPWKDMLCNTLLSMNNSSEKYRMMLEVLTPDTKLNRIIAGAENILKLEKALRVQDLINLINNPLICDVELFEIRKICLPMILAYLTDTPNKKEILYALDPELPLYKFLALQRRGIFSNGPLFINHESKELNQMRQSHPEVLLEMLEQGGHFDDEHLQYLSVAEKQLLEHITQLPCDERKQNLFINLLQEKSSSVFKLLNSKCKQLIQSNLDVVIELIAHERLNGDVLENTLGSYRDKILDHIQQQLHTEPGKRWLKWVDHQGHALSNFINITNSSKSTKRKREERITAMRGLLSQGIFSSADPGPSQTPSLTH